MSLAVVLHPTQGTPVGLMQPDSVHECDYRKVVFHFQETPLLAEMYFFICHPMKDKSLKIKVRNTCNTTRNSLSEPDNLPTITTI